MMLREEQIPVTSQRDVDLVAAWAVDRLGRSLVDLPGFLGELHAKQVGSVSKVPIRSATRSL